MGGRDGLALEVRDLLRRRSVLHKVKQLEGGLLDRVWLKMQHMRFKGSAFE